MFVWLGVNAGILRWQARRKSVSKMQLNSYK